MASLASLEVMAPDTVPATRVPISRAIRCTVLVPTPNSRATFNIPVPPASRARDGVRHVPADHRPAQHHTRRLGPIEASY